MCIINTEKIEKAFIEVAVCTNFEGEAMADQICHRYAIDRLRARIASGKALPDTVLICLFPMQYKDLYESLKMGIAFGWQKGAEATRNKLNLLHEAEIERINRLHKYKIQELYRLHEEEQQNLPANPIAASFQHSALYWPYVVGFIVLGMAAKLIWGIF
jgi:hypothetical protein